MIECARKFSGGKHLKSSSWPRSPSWHAWVGGLCAAALFSLAGCGGSNSSGNPITKLWRENQAAEDIGHVQTVEPLLQAAGFTRRDADTPAKVAHLESLTPYRIRYYVNSKGMPRYHFADPSFCHCVYIGDDANYQRYQKLKADRLAQNSGSSQAAIESINQDQLSQEVGVPEINGFDSVWGP
jgi:hypothetical protein